MKSFVRLFSMAATGAALLAATALTYPGPRSAMSAPQPTLARLSSSAMRTVTAHLFQKARVHHPDIACSNGHRDA